MNTNEMLTTDEAADMLRVIPDTVRRWIRNGILPAVKVGKQYLIPIANVRGLLSARDIVGAAHGSAGPSRAANLDAKSEMTSEAVAAILAVLNAHKGAS